MKNKVAPENYKDELANICEMKRFSQDAENLLLSTVYKLEDSYDNYASVKVEVPAYDNFIIELLNNVRMNCQNILIAEPRTMLERELKKGQVNILTEQDMRTKGRRVISYPNEKTLLYQIEKASLMPLGNDLSIEEKAIITTINIGKCISKSESIRDFNGWSWSISKNEIESIECNIIYVFLSILVGYEELENVNIQRLKSIIPQSLYEQILKFSLNFYTSRDKKQNEAILKKITQDKMKMEKMKNKTSFLQDVNEKKNRRIVEIRKIDEILNNPQLLRDQYINYNSKLPNEKRLSSLGFYVIKLQNRKKQLMIQIDNLNKFFDPDIYVMEKAKIGAEIRLYEDKTNIKELQREFLKCLKTKMDMIDNKKDITDLLYEVRYLEFLPACKMDLTEIEEKLIPKAIRLRALEPVSNNDLIDYRILRGIFKSKAIRLDNLYIRITPSEMGLRCGIYDGDVLEETYDVRIPEGATFEIMRNHRSKIFG